MYFVGELDLPKIKLLILLQAQQFVKISRYFIEAVAMCQL